MTDSTTLSARCRSCEAVYDATSAPLQCPACQALVAPHPQSSPFARLGVAATFAQDPKALEAAWLQRSRQVHPDRFVKNADAERRASAEQSAAVNDAWRTLRDPFSRAVWLLKSVGVVEPKLPQARLFALMQAREEAEDAAGRVRVVDNTGREFATLFAQVQQKLTRADDGGWVAGNVELKGIAQSLAELRTLARLSADLGGPTLIASLDGR